MAEAPSEQAQWQKRFTEAMTQGFVPAGRILANAGTAPHASLINCFVLPLDPSVPFSVQARSATTTLQAGGGVGYDLTPLPASHTRSAMSSTQGAMSPVPALLWLDEACRHMQARRVGAQMAVLRWDHPDILSFIRLKQTQPLPTFTLSVGLTDAFMQGVTHGLHAEVWQALTQGAFECGEPGVLFLDQIHRDNNLSYCESITATNPCGEQPLPSFGGCCLGSLDLTRFVTSPFHTQACVDFARLSTVVPVAVRMLDNALSMTDWPLQAQAEQAAATRRIGLGITGLGDALMMLNLPYGTQAARSCVQLIMSRIRDEAYAASIGLARDRGAFPRLDRAAYLQAPHFASRLPQHLQSEVWRHGIRNSHLLCVAPAGSISMALCDNVSSGIEPPFGWRYARTITNADGQPVRRFVEDHAWRLFSRSQGATTRRPSSFCTAWELPPEDHLAMQAAIAPYVDGAISKTINVPQHLPFAAFQQLYVQAWRLGLKGFSVYRPNRWLPPVIDAPAPCNGTC